MLPSAALGGMAPKGTRSLRMDLGIVRVRNLLESHCGLRAHGCQTASTAAMCDVQFPCAWARCGPDVRVYADSRRHSMATSFSLCTEKPYRISPFAMR